MCFSDDAELPIEAQPALLGDHGEIELTAADGNRFSAYRARAATPGAAGIVVLPDVRGLHAFYRGLADRFAEHGIDAVAIDYFGRTAGMGSRDDSFEYGPHVEQTTREGVRADVDAAMAALRAPEGAGAQAIFTVGFCFGGSNSWVQADRTDLAGAIGFYGRPSRLPEGFATLVKAPILLLAAGDDALIPADQYEQLAAELWQAGVDYELKVYEGAPHSFFDRRFAEFAPECADAWGRILDFVQQHTAEPSRS